MPIFLENRLKSQGRKKGFKGRRLQAFVFGTLNNMGAMRGNKITEKGREMERKHRRTIAQGG